MAIEATVEGGDRLGAKFAEWRDETVRAYRESGLFSEVVVGLQPNDLRAKIAIKEKVAVDHADFAISALTLTVIPYVEDHYLTIQTVLLGRGGEQATFEHSRSSRTWFELLLVAAAPFTSRPQQVAKETVYDLNRATLREARGSLSKLLEAAPVTNR